MSTTNSNTATPITGITGIGRDGHQSTALLIYLDHNPSDDEMRAIRQKLKEPDALPAIAPPDGPVPFEQMHAQLLNMLGAETHEAAAALIGHLMGADIAARQPVGQRPAVRDVMVNCALRMYIANKQQGETPIDAMRQALRGAFEYLEPPAPAAVPVDASWSLHDRIEFALRDAGFGLDEASKIATLATHPQPTAAKDGDA